MPNKELVKMKTKTKKGWLILRAGQPVTREDDIALSMINLCIWKI